MTRVVNAHREPYDVLIARPSKWGNYAPVGGSKGVIVDALVLGWRWNFPDAMVKANSGIIPFFLLP